MLLARIDLFEATERQNPDAILVSRASTFVPEALLPHIYASALRVTSILRRYTLLISLSSDSISPSSRWLALALLILDGSQDLLYSEEMS